MAKNTNFDITITQRGDLYFVSGLDAPALYNKLQLIPPEAQTLEVGQLENGFFTMRKIMPYTENMASDMHAAC